MRPGSPACLGRTDRAVIDADTPIRRYDCFLGRSVSHRSRRKRADNLQLTADDDITCRTTIANSFRNGSIHCISFH